MLDQLFLKLLNMSISAGWLALVVMVLRPLMKRVPKAIHCLLWGLVGLRLIWPFSIESILSLLPSAQTVPPEIVYEQSPAIQSGVPAINAVVNPILSESSAANPMTSVNPLQIWLFLVENLWVLGMVVLFLYVAISYLRIALKVRARLPLGDGIYVCDGVDTPFILGVIRPKIFLPSSLGGEEQAYVIAHEQAHLKRKDHWWKPLGFLLLTVHWFNPLMWIAYILLCRDIEMACDERVIREMGIDDKKAYSRALLQCSAPRRLISACPLAFGEVGVAQRVRSVLHYKKPAFWIILVALLMSIALAVCFLTDPIAKRKNENLNFNVLETVSSYPGVSLELTSVIGQEITVTWINDSDQEMEFGDPFKLYRAEGEEWVEPLRGEANFELPAYPLSPGKKRSHVYPIHHYDISMEGLYRFESEFRVGREEHTIRVDFQLKEGIANHKIRLYNPIAMTYTHGGFSFVQTAGGAPCIGLREHQNGISLQVYERNVWQDCGLVTPITLTEENFDQRFVSAQIWEEKTDAATLRKNNKIAYEVKKDGCLYLVLAQKDGTVYYATGHYDVPEMIIPNKDSSFIRWLYRTEAVLSIPAEKKKVTILYFTYPESNEPMAPALNLFLADQSFDFCYSTYSSYLAYGHYERVGDDLILKTKDGLNTYTFKIQGQTLVFDAARSSKLPEYKDSNNVPQPPLPDGAVFETGMEGETIDDYVPKT